MDRHVAGQLTEADIEPGQGQALGVLIGLLLPALTDLGVQQSINSVVVKVEVGHIQTGKSGGVVAPGAAVENADVKGAVLETADILLGGRGDLTIRIYLSSDAAVAASLDLFDKVVHRDAQRGGAIAFKFDCRRG